MRITGVRIRGTKVKDASPTSVGDSYFNLVTLLLPGNGTNGAQNNTFLDSSSNGLTITRNGNTTQGTFSPFSQTGWSNYFDGNGDYLTFPANAAFTFGTGDFTIEGWVYIDALGSVNAIGVFQQGTSSFPTSVSNSVAVGVNPASTWAIYANGTNTNSTATVSIKSWTHFALVRSGTTTTLYANGTSVIQITSDSTNYTGTYFGIGSIYGTSGTNWNGYISNLRVLKGTALYTAAFTPPTAPLTAISGTSLLTCQSNRFVDNSTNAFAITINGNTSVQAFSPFNPTAAYSAGTVGGSAYFDGTGDRLTTSASSAIDLSTADFTIEAFVYLTSYRTEAICTYQNGDATNSNYGYILYVNSSGYPSFQSLSGSSQQGPTSTILAPLNAWTHIAVTRTGTTINLYVNGVGTSGTAYSTFNSPSGAVLIVGDNFGPTFGSSMPFIGYISGLRIVKGSRVYTSNFTPPTAPPTAITNTSLLLNYTNAGITDATAKNVIETVDNAQISNGQAKWGSTSMYFDGTGDRLQIPASQNSVFGTGDFTVECWIYVASNPAQYTCIVSNWAGADPAWILNFSNGSGNIRFNDNSTVYLTSSSALTTGQWNHVAVSRSGTSLKMFFNGTQVASATNSTSFGSGSAVVTVGGYYDNSYVLTGYIDDLRITKGLARYTADFTPPTTAFPTQ